MHTGRWNHGAKLMYDGNDDAYVTRDYKAYSPVSHGIEDASGNDSLYASK